MTKVDEQRDLLSCGNSIEAEERSHSHAHAHEHSHSHYHDGVHAHAQEDERLAEQEQVREQPSAVEEHAHFHENTHSHEHTHHHEHAHEHTHHHEHAHEPARVAEQRPECLKRPLLERGAGIGKYLVLDTFSGIAGDMTIAAMVDLGVPESVVIEGLSLLGLAGVEYEFTPVFVGAIGATKFSVRQISEQPIRSYSGIRRLIEQSALPAQVKRISLRAFQILAEAEAEVHRVPLDEVHFHEVGAVDSIADMVGAALCFDYLGADIKVTPLPMGRGFVLCDHGRIPLPAPATLGCLRGFPTVAAGIEAELVTPTGAALVAAIAEPTEGWADMVPEAIGWGAGTRRLPDRPNALRVVLGAPLRDYQTDSHELLEANVDDLTGELASYALDAALSAGAVDAWVVPITMKKGRPGWVLSALVPSHAVDAVSFSLMRETSTIGVRRRKVSRLERPREQKVVETRFGEVRVKVSGGDFGAPQLKPEFEDCRRLAEQQDISVKEIMEEALTVARRALKER